MCRHAVVEALTEEMIRDQRVCVWGEDVAEQGGAYVATSGLLEIFGRERVFNYAHLRVGHLRDGGGRRHGRAAARWSS